MRISKWSAKRAAAVKRGKTGVETKAYWRRRGPIPDRPPERPEAGTLLGSLRWHGVTGVVKQLVVRQGKRANSIHIDGMNREIGWDELFKNLRGKLSMRKVDFEKSGSNRMPRCQLTSR